jgi:hypothetical protein
MVTKTGFMKKTAVSRRVIDKNAGRPMRYFLNMMANLVQYNSAGSYDPRVQYSLHYKSDRT